MNPVWSFRLELSATPASRNGTSVTLYLVARPGNTRWNPTVYVHPCDGRRLHSAEQHADTARLSAFDHCGEVLLDRLVRNTSQPVVRTQLENHDPGVVRQHRIDPTHAVGCDSSACAGVHDPPGVASGIEPLLKNRWEVVRVGRRYGETVPQDDHMAYCRTALADGPGWCGRARAVQEINETLATSGHDSDAPQTFGRLVILIFYVRGLRAMDWTLA